MYKKVLGLSTLHVDTYIFCYNFETASPKQKVYINKVIWKKFVRKSFTLFFSIPILWFMCIHVTSTYIFYYIFETVNPRPKAYNTK